MEIKFSQSDKYNISDIYAYLFQYEHDIVRNDNKSMLPFCADIALKRLFLYDTCPKAFGKRINRNRIITDIENHIFAGRCTENTEKLYEKVCKKVLPF
jgi:hypothetical protein